MIHELFGGLSILEVLLLLVAVVIMFGPIIHILLSGRSHGGAKFGWFLAAFVFPIIAYIVFLIVTQQMADSRKTRNEQQ